MPDDTLYRRMSNLNNAYGIPSSNFPYPQRNNDIHSWNYTPEIFSFLKVSDEEELYLGCEIEVDKGGISPQAVRKVKEIINSSDEIVYVKGDGSITNGFEIVTHPCTYEFHKEKVRYQELFEVLIKIGYRAHDTDTCGLHVHINRSFFGSNKLDQDLGASKLLYLMEKFWDKVTLIARRDSNRYAQRFRLEENETPLDMYAKSKNSCKYGAVNLQHKDTVEIRIFKGTLNYNTFICTLEFVKKIVKLAKDTDIYFIQGVTWNDILAKFSDGLIKYINNREEKHKEKQLQTVGVDNTYIGSRQSMIEPSYEYTTSFMPSDIRRSSDIMRSFDMMRTSLMDVPSPATLTLIEQEELDELQLKNEIKRIKRLISRSRNELEKLSFRRILDGLERDLRELRNRVNPSQN